MAANYPEFRGPDGVLRQNFKLSTTIPIRFFDGEMPADTVDMQVSVRGAPFTSDPDYITFEGTSFTVPNPSAFPEGLQLLPGSNDIKVKAILSTGSSTELAGVSASLSLEANVGGLLHAPTGIFLERQDGDVVITVEGLEDTNDEVVGYHFYASPQQGGGDVGYFRINPSLVITGETVEAEEDLAALSVDASVALNDEGGHAADPLYFRLQGGQEDRIETSLVTNFNEVLEVPETTDHLRIETTIKTVRRTQQFSFTHDRQATLSSTLNPALPHSALAVVPDTAPLYYVVSAVYLLEDGVETESFFSPEVLGAPLRITPNVGAFPQVGRQQIVRGAVLSIYRSNPQVRVDPGSALRDTFLDPFSTEADRIRFIIDFLHNAQSFATLLIIDDPALTGESVAVSRSSYKTALKEAFHLASDQEVQTIIDNAFDKLASNNGVVRDGGKRARGEVTFYVTDKPSTAISKAIGTLMQGGGVNFRTTSSASISTLGGGKGYNPQTGRYFARAFIQADVSGADGNLAVGQITTILNNTLNVRVVNEGPTFGGTNRESNRNLALRAIRVVSSVDSGTLQGYVDNATNVPGVREVSIIASGDPLMMRDRNDDGRHVGGKVDMYLRGESEASVTDSFAFKFENRRYQQFESVGDISNLRFRAVDPALSEEHPIIEMIDLPDHDLVFENASKGTVFDLTDVTIVAYNQIELSSEHNDPTNHDLDDEIRGSYRYRTSDRFVLTRQPVIEIDSFIGTRTGEVTEGVYELYRASDPLELGRSSEAGDYLQVVEPLDDEGTTIPSGDPVVVTDEEHTMLEGPEYLHNLGAVQLTVRVWNDERTIEYNGPLSNEARDFTFIEGDETTPLGIQLTDSSRITEGQTVLVDYSHDENFTVSYTSNAVVSVVQNQIDGDSHITADAIAKWAVDLPVDLTATIVMQPNTAEGVVDSRVRTELARLFNTFGLGTPVRQSDVIRAIDSVIGVSYVVTPLTKMVRGDDALIVREAISTFTTGDFVQIAAWSSATVNVFLLLNPLDSSTINAGGVRSEFRGVFEDEVRLVHHEVAPNVNGFPLRGSTGGTFIIGSDGLNIPGYSDNATIEANNVLPTDPDEKEAEILRIRKAMTANRVLVSYAPGGDMPDNPELHDYKVTYLVTGDTGVKNIEPGPIEHLVLGDLNFVYDEAT